MSIDLCLVPGGNCCIFCWHLFFVLMAVLAILGANTYCDETYANDEGSMQPGVALGCFDEKRCELLSRGQELTTATEDSCFSNNVSSFDCECVGLGTNDPSFTILVLCALFFVVKLVIELYLIWCANFLCTQSFKQESKKICMKYIYRKFAEYIIYII